MRLPFNNNTQTSENFWNFSCVKLQLYMNGEGNYTTECTIHRLKNSSNALVTMCTRDYKLNTDAIL